MTTGVLLLFLVTDDVVTVSDPDLLEQALTADTWDVDGEEVAVAARSWRPHGER